MENLLSCHTFNYTVREGIWRIVATICGVKHTRKQVFTGFTISSQVRTKVKVYLSFSIMFLAMRR